MAVKLRDSAYGADESMYVPLRWILPNFQPEPFGLIRY